MKSSLRMITRRLCLRKGLTITAATIFIIGFFGAYHLSHRGSGINVDIDSIPRNVKVVRFSWGGGWGAEEVNSGSLTVATKFSL